MFLARQGKGGFQATWTLFNFSRLRASSTVGAAALGAMRPEVTEPRVYQMDRPDIGRGYSAPSQGFAEMAGGFSARVETVETHDERPLEALPLGAARAQVH